VGLGPGAAPGDELDDGASEEGGVPGCWVVVVDGAAGAVLSVLSEELVGVDGLSDEVAVTTGGGIRDVDGRRPAVEDEGRVPGRSVKVGMASGGGAAGGELADGVVVEFGWLAAGVGWTVVYWVSVTTTSRDPSLVFRLAVEVGASAEVEGPAEVKDPAEVEGIVGVGGMAIGAAVLVVAGSVAFDC
jgi:hypothetical protein